MATRGKIAIGGLDHKEEAVAPDHAKDEATDRPSPLPKTEAQAESRATEDAPQGGRSYDPPPRRPRSERKNAFDLGSWLIEGVLGIAEEVQHNDLGLSEEFWTHAYAARKEALLAARALIDTALEHCAEDDAATTKTRSARQRRGRVNINFD